MSETSLSSASASDPPPPREKAKRAWWKPLPLGLHLDPALFSGANIHILGSLLLSFLVGPLVGLSAVFFALWIHWVRAYTVEPLRAFEPLYPLMTPGWHWLIPLVPVAGLLVVSGITRFYAAEVRGSGVPEVISAVACRHGIIRQRVMWLKALLSGLTVGTGGSVGTEGPIIQTGAALASQFGQTFKISERNMKILVASGAAAGISASFGAPLAGVLFACEVILGNFALNSLTPIVLAAVLSNLTFELGISYFDPHGVNVAGEVRPLLGLAEYRLENPFALPLYLILGVLSGFVAVSFNHAIYRTEDFFQKYLPKWWQRALVGGLAVGLIGMPPVMHSLNGNGYETIQACLEATSMDAVELSAGILLILLVFKITITSITLGGGGSGGIFAPSLFLGAVLGGIFGQVLCWISPELGFRPGSFSVVGMAAVVAGTTHAPISTVLILFEMTLNYSIILPLMCAAVLASVTSSYLDPESIYLKKLARRGELATFSHHTTSLEDIYVRDLMIRNFPTVPLDANLTDMVRAATSHPNLEALPVVDRQGKLTGIIGSEDLHRMLDSDLQPSLVRADDLVRETPTVLSPEDNLLLALGGFGERDLEVLPVMSLATTGPRRLVGLLTREDAIRRYREELRRHHHRQRKAF
ncbi:CBS domain-containing protein [Planctomycetales bacterium 10988]|nr:CBS domain-containing protein [Planctomycetales bacterium 10988]